MKIIGGNYKGTNLFTPKDNNTRPMVARVRNSLFNIILSDIKEAIVLDLFAGTGCLGLEALSRGAKFCYFVENQSNILQILKKNIQKLRVNDKTKIIKRDVFKLWGILKENIIFDIIFFDPPYIFFDNPIQRKMCLDFLERIGKEYFSSKCWIILHYRRGRMAGVPIPQIFYKWDSRVYGTTELMFLRKVNND